MTDNVAWRKSSHSGGSGGDCVEVGQWRKSSYSGGQGGECVAVSDRANVIRIRDTKDRDGETLTLTADAWKVFVASLKR
jgi:hypothetical protein